MTPAHAVPRKAARKINGEFKDVTHLFPLIQMDGLSVKVFALNALRVLMTEEPTGLHISISHPSRYPTWDEIAHARYTLLPKDQTFAMLLPPEEEYVNVEGGHRSGNIFHLHELQPGELRGA